MIGKTNVAGGGGKKIEPVYSIIYDKTMGFDKSNSLRYANLCEGFEPIHAKNEASGNLTEGDWAVGNGTIFDSIEVGHMEGTTWVPDSKSAVPGSTEYNCFTRFPKIYQKVTTLKTNVVKLDISTEPFDGATVHPAFVEDGIERNHKYISRYLVSDAGPAIKSISGGTYFSVAPNSGGGGTDMYSYYCKKNGDGYNSMNYFDWDLVNKFVLLGTKTFNVGLQIGGNVSTKSTTSGGTDGNSWMYGGYSNRVSFLGLEDWIGKNVNMVAVSDTYYDGTALYAGNNSNRNSTSSTNKVKLANGINRGSTIETLNFRAGLNNFFMAQTKVSSNLTSDVRSVINNASQVYASSERTRGLGVCYGSPYGLYTDITSNYQYGRLTYMD